MPSTQPVNGWTRRWPVGGHSEYNPCRVTIVSRASRAGVSGPPPPVAERFLSATTSGRNDACSFSVAAAASRTSETHGLVRRSPSRPAQRKDRCAPITTQAYSTSSGGASQEPQSSSSNTSSGLSKASNTSNTGRDSNNSPMDANARTSWVPGGQGQGRSLGPLRLVDLPGKGRGVVATRRLQPGELLLVCRPLALVQGSQPSAASTAASISTSGQRRAAAQSEAPGQRRKPGPAVGAARATGVPVPGSAAAAAAAATEGTGSAAAGGAGVVSEAALVSELQQLEWGPRQAKILNFLYRGPQQPGPLQQSRSRRPLTTAQPATSGQAALASAAAMGSSRSSITGGGGSVVSLDLLDLTDPWSTSEDPAGDGGPAVAMTRGSELLPEEQLAAVVRLNSTGLPSDDVLLAKLYGKLNLPFIGLWPAHAMLNHSCAPNAVAVVSGSQLLIRCCVPVSPGAEVCITYSGALGLGPLPLRRALLERNHRFRCMCARCTAEEKVPRELAQLWSDIVMLASQQLQPRLMSAAAALRSSSTRGSSSSGGGSSQRGEGSGDGSSAASAAAAAAAAALPSLLDIRGQVAKCCGLFEETLGQLAPSPQDALWLQASLYPLYETRARCAQLLAEAAAAAATSAAPPTGPPASGAAGPAAQGPMPQLQRGQTVEGGLEQAEQQQQPPQPEGPGAAEMERRLSEEYLDALSACLRLQGVANAGSDMHVQLAARYDAACASHAARHTGARAQQLAADARQRLERALSARYGAAVQAPEAPGEAGPGVAKARLSGAELQLVPSLEALLSALEQLQMPTRRPLT